MVLLHRWLSLLIFSPFAAAFTTRILPQRTSTTALSVVDETSELTSALATLDKQWQIQQKAQPQSRWSKLQLPPVEENEASSQDFVYLLEPPNNSRPSSLIVFTGGAGLGTYPQIAYNEFLLRLSDRLNAAILTAPYDVGLDHFALSKTTGDLTRRAMIYCQDSERAYPASLPTFSLSHSLGAKLACIYAAATEQDYDGMGFLAFNNFSFGKTIGMAKQFAETIRQNTGLGSGVAAGVSNEALNSLFNFAEMAVSASGIDFSPSQEQMNLLIRKKYTRAQQLKTRLFSFDDDLLENTEDFVKACQSGEHSQEEGDVVQVSALPGTHLTPVFFQFDLDEVVPEEARQMASETMGGFKGASFGNQKELDALVDEVCNWILGKGPPSRKPQWMRDRPQIPATSSASESSS